MAKVNDAPILHVNADDVARLFLTWVCLVRRFFFFVSPWMRCP